MRSAIFVYDKKGESQAEAFISLIRDMERCGWFIEFTTSWQDFVASDKKVDMLIAQTDALVQPMLDRPMVLLERLDGCQLTGATRRSIEHPNVLAVMKGWSFKNASDHCIYGDRRHVAEMNPAAHAGRPTPVSEGAQRKIKLAFSYACYRPVVSQMPAYLEWASERPVEAFFAGTVEYGVAEIQAHRQAACDAVKAIPGGMASAGRNIPAANYTNLVRYSRCVVSPWGYGEVCYRDYEALLAGCDLIKPNSPWVETADRVFDSMGVLWCNHDFSDLAQVVATSQETWKYRLPAKRDFADQLAAEYQKGVSAQRVAHILDGAYDRAASRST
jgi:hypothetical protein